mmetsp:Transcript_48468/g.75688  ORF Transcript_48468/g.75688 Transcript_48468/m.75688 type:complete len:103 (-) Transcript_48468:62-370(-)
MRDGSWNFGEFKTGHVRIIWKDGRVYDGEFMDGEISGDGIITWHNGTSVKGHFVRGKYPLEASMSKNRGENDFDVKLFGKVSSTENPAVPDYRPSRSRSSEH